MDILERIKVAAQKKNLTISEVEVRSGISNGSIGKWEHSIPKADSLYKVALILEMPIEYFLTGNITQVTSELTADENLLLQQYRTLDLKDQREIHRIIEMKLDDLFQPTRSSTLPCGKKSTAAEETA